MLLEYKVRKCAHHGWLCKEAWIPPIREMTNIKLHMAPLAFHAVAFDFKERYPSGETFKEEFTNIILGMKSTGNTMPLLSNVVHWKFHNSCYKITLSVCTGQLS